MKTFRGVVLSALSVAFLIISCSKNGNQNPVTPTDETCTISGKVVNIDWISLYFGYSFYDTINVNVHLTGETVDMTTTPDPNGLYSFHEVPKGTYSLVPMKDGTKFTPEEVSLHVTDNAYEVPEFLCYRMGEDEYIIVGKIVESNGQPVPRVKVQGIGEFSYGYTDERGYYRIGFCEKGQIQTVHPFKEGYEYSFFPETRIVTITDNITVCNFAVSYSGPPLHIITGRVLDVNNNGILTLVTVYAGTKRIRQALTDNSGVYTFYGMKDGHYTLEYQFGGRKLRTEEIPREVILNGEDIHLPDIRDANNSTFYKILGRVIDLKGKGIPEVTIRFYRIYGNTEALVVELTTDTEGRFEREIRLGYNNSETQIIRPFKEFFEFTPDSIPVTLHWIKGEEYGEDIILPDFIGHDYSTLTVSDYFPLETGITWTYIRTENDDDPYDFTINVTGKVNNGGLMYHRFSDPGPWNFTDFRIENNNVYAFSDDEDVLLFKFGVVPGTRWESGVIAGTYTRKGTFIGIETVDTPAGTFENCVHFESKIVYGETSYDSYDLWYAPGVGLVRSVKIVENYGRRLEYVVDELKEYEMP